MRDKGERRLKRLYSQVTYRTIERKEKGNNWEKKSKTMLMVSVNVLAIVVVLLL